MAASHGRADAGGRHARLLAALGLGLALAVLCGRPAHGAFPTTKTPDDAAKEIITAFVKGRVRDPGNFEIDLTGESRWFKQ